MPKQHLQRPPAAKGRPVKRRPGRPTLRELQSRLDTRDFLIGAAGELMSAKGSVAISLREIALATGLTAPLVQYHFGNKDGLLIALLERDAKAMLRLRDLADEDLPAAVKLRLHIGGLVNASFRAPYINQLLKVMENEGGKKAQLVNELFIRPLAEFQRKLLEQGQKEGIFSEISPVEFYCMIIGACDHFFANRKMLSDVFGVYAITEEMRLGFARSLTAMVLKGLAVK